MLGADVLARGAGGAPGLVSGVLRRWSGVTDTEPLEGVVAYIDGALPLYAAAALVDRGPAAVVIAEGGKNYHPLILLSDAQVPAVAGVGELTQEGLVVTVDSTTGTLFAGAHAGPREETPASVSGSASDPVYVNVGYPTALEAAAATGAAGIGLLRTEFSGVQALARNLSAKCEDGRTLQEVVECTSEADAIYRMASDSRLRDLLRDEWAEVIRRAVRAFGSRPVIVRTLDIARDLDDPMGNRGIRRCVAEGGETLRLLGESICDAISSSGQSASIGVILPLVSHYGQIEAARTAMVDAGLDTRGPGQDRPLGIQFGWEVEQPAAALNNEAWLRAYSESHGRGPHLIGVGTNDLTQFTIALGRDTAAMEQEGEMRTYLESLYDELDFSIVRQIRAIARDAGSYGTQVFLLGQAAARPEVAQLMRALGVLPSVGLDKVAEVSAHLEEFAHESASSVIEGYVGRVCESYPPRCREAVRSELLRMLLPT